MDRSIGFGLVGLALSGVYLTATQTIRSQAFGDVVGAAGLPNILGWALGVLSCLLIVSTWLRSRRGMSALDAPEPENDEFLDPRRAWLRGSGIAALAVTYVVILPVLGYIISIALLIVATALYFGVPRSWRVAAIASLGAMALWGLFHLALQIPLPTGPLAFLG